TPLLCELVPAVAQCRVQHRSVRKHHTDGIHGVICVLYVSTAHATGVICSHATDHCRIDGSGIGSYLALKSSEGAIDAATERRWLATNEESVAADVYSIP